MTNWSSPLRGPFRDINDKDLKLGRCDFCGKSENTDVISRAPCEDCKKVVCWECADCGVYGSLLDFQNFIHRHTYAVKKSISSLRVVPIAKKLRGGKSTPHQAKLFKQSTT